MILQIEPWIDKEELVQLKRVVDSTFVTEAELTKEFEQMTKDLTGAQHAIAMTNGTVALYCGLKSLGIGEGDEVIVPDLTFIASANAIIMAGATPVLCDIYDDTFCINVEEAEKLITKNTKAIMPVHLYGQSADMIKIMDLASSYNLNVIEDAAQGVGVKFTNKHVGTFGDLGVLSYYGNKTITTGEGGMLITNNDYIAEKCYRLKNHGRLKKGTFVHNEIGFNFSFTEMQAAIGISQMNKLPMVIKKKRQIQIEYNKKLSGLDQFSPVSVDERTSPVFWFTSFLCEKIDKLTRHLNESNIQTRRFFYPLHLQPCYQNSNVSIIMEEEYPVTDYAYNKGISLPSSCSLNKITQTEIIDKIKSFYLSND